MGWLLGRDPELQRVQAALSRSRAGVGATVRIAGASGIGKTAFLDASVESASAGGWLVTRTQCHRIQAGLPFAAAQRLAHAALEALGNERGRYAGGLDRAFDDRASTAEGLFRLLEGVLHDYPVLLAIDDAQWIDPESRDLLERLVQTFADRAIMLLAMEVPGSSILDGVHFDDSLSLGPLLASDSADVVRAHYPGANEVVVQTIVEHSGGNPIDLVSLAGSARDAGTTDASGVEASVRSSIARQLNALDARLREFLQFCALIPEPIEYRTLALLWPDAGQLESLIAAASGKYLVQDGADLRFTHSVIAQSVRQTMPVEIPFRRRILAALASAPSLSLEDYERMIQQAMACGDYALARTYLLRLATQATKEAALATAADAFKRALELASPSRDELVRFYLDYAAVLTVQGRMAETKSLMQVGLDEAATLGVTDGVGGLAATFLISLWGTKRAASALEAYRGLEGRFASSSDRLQLYSVAAWLYACNADEDGFERTKNAMLEVEGGLPPEIAMRLNNAEAFLRLRQGHAGEASSLIEIAAAHSSAVSSGNRRTIEVGRVVIQFLRHGLRDADTEKPAARMRHSADIDRNFVIEVIRSIQAMARGNIGDASEMLRDALGRTTERMSRLHLLAVWAAIGTLTEQSSLYDQAMDDEVAQFARADTVDPHAGIAAWRAAAKAHTQPQKAREYVELVLKYVAHPYAPDFQFFPIALSLAAARLNDRALLERLAEGAGMWEDRAPWHVAQRRLAMGYARQALRARSGESLLAEARTRFDELQSPLFSAMARASLDAHDAQAVAVLDAAGIKDFLTQSVHKGPTPERKRKGGTVPSRRELEIIELVAAGSSNREIAERLFLSERTVEAHLSNIFQKLDLSKRTQLAAWHLRSASPLASSQKYSQPVEADRH